MTSRIVVVAIVVFALLLAACQPAPSAVDTPPAREAPVEPAATQPAPQPEAEAYPAPNEAGAAEELAAAGSGAYPGIADGSQILWEQAVTLIENAEVENITIAGDTATINLIDGRTLTVPIPAGLDFQRIIESCGEPCSGVQVTTE